MIIPRNQEKRAVIRTNVLPRLPAPLTDGTIKEDIHDILEQFLFTYSGSAAE